MKAEATERCAQDGLFYLRFVKTRDEADPTVSVKPFPVQLDYVQALWTVVTGADRIAIAKSRQMLVSWFLCIFATWRARFRSNQLILWQTQSWPDATEKTAGPKGAKMGRCQFIEANLPSWLREPRLSCSEGILDYPNGSRIQALPGGADKIRGLTASVIIEDEMAMQTEARGVYAAAAPLIDKGCKFIACSTPNGIGNIFADIYHGYDTRLGQT